MRRLTSLLAATCLIASVGCEEQKKEGEATKAAETPAEKPADPAAEPAEPAAEDPAEDPAAGQPAESAEVVKDIGVEPGGFEYDEKDGAEAIVSAVTGKVELRKVGTEAWEEAKAETELHPGDQIRTGDNATATLALADETSVEVAEESAIAIGSREATQDPASSAAVLYGVARFSVAERAEGEGPFIVYTQSGVVQTKGTVYTVGSVASGTTRVGVEEGSVDVSGSAALDAPVAVEGGSAVEIAPEGEAGAVQPMGTDDWGTWRDEMEAKVKAEEAAKFHADRAEKLEAELQTAYAELEVQTKAAADAEARAQEAEAAKDTKAYEAAAPEIGGAVDASFAASMRLQYLTNAMLAHAYIADSLYVRHPSVVPILAKRRARLAASILWHKKYHWVSYEYMRPLRPYWYRHHPRGRLHARHVRYVVPAFYAGVNLRYRPIEVRTRVRFPVFRVVEVRPRARVRKTVWVEGPRRGWYDATVRTRVRPAKARARWYVKPKAPKARLVVGTRPSGEIKAVFRTAPPRRRDRAVVRFGGGMRGGAEVRRRGASARVRGGVKVDAPDVRGKVGVGVRAGADEARGAAGGVGGRVRAGVDVGGGAGVDVKGGAGGRVRAGVDDTGADPGGRIPGRGKAGAGGAAGGAGVAVGEPNPADPNKGKGAGGAKKAEREAKQAERDAKKAEREAKKAAGGAGAGGAGAGGAGADAKAERDAKKAEREAKKAERDAKKAERDAKKAERDAKKGAGGGAGGAGPKKDRKKKEGEAPAPAP
jgi:hypothetical protein